MLAGFNQADELDHLAPALYFERHQALLDEVDAETIERAARLFERLNGQLS